MCAFGDRTCVSRSKSSNRLLKQKKQRNKRGLWVRVSEWVERRSHGIAFLDRSLRTYVRWLYLSRSPLHNNRHAFAHPASKRTFPCLCECSDDDASEPAAAAADNASSRASCMLDGPCDFCTARAPQQSAVHATREAAAMPCARVRVWMALAMLLIAPQKIAAVKSRVVVDTPSGKVEGVDRGTSTCESHCIVIPRGQQENHQTLSACMLLQDLSLSVHAPACARGGQL